MSFLARGFTVLASAALAAFLCLALYAFSIGPAARIAQDSRSGSRLIETVYRPVIDLIDHDARLKTWLKWYLDLWGIR
jgi:hypothetical protein